MERERPKSPATGHIKKRGDRHNDKRNTGSPRFYVVAKKRIGLFHFVVKIGTGFELNRFAGGNLNFFFCAGVDTCAGTFF